MMPSHSKGHWKAMPAIVLAAVLVAGCQGEGVTQTPASEAPSDSSPLVGRTFLSSSVTGYQLVATSRISLSFTDDGKLNAQAGCNHLFGNLAIEGDKLNVSDMGGTDMACDKPLMDQDDWFIKFMTAKPTWKLDGDELVLAGSGTEIKLLDREVADPDRPLEGIQWVVESLLDGESASSLPQGAQAYLQFDADKVSGNTGCNMLTGTFTSTGEAITFSGIATTKIACPGDVNVLEQKVLAVVNGEVTFSIEADRLVLVHSSGQGLHLRASV